MKHRAARRLLPQLLDEALPPACAEHVRSHARECARCRRELAELELCDRLVARLPLAVIPLTARRAGERRLEGLARWALPRRVRHSPWLALEGAAAAAAAGLFAGGLALAGAAGWLPAAAPSAGSPIQVAFVSAGAGQD